MANTNGGGPAFPILNVHQPWNRESKEYDGVQTDIVAPGMELRDYIATKAMAAYLSLTDDDKVGNAARDNPDRVAQWSYDHADAMLRARVAQRDYVDWGSGEALAMAALDVYPIDDGLPKSTSVVFRIHQLGRAYQARAAQSPAERQAGHIAEFGK